MASCTCRINEVDTRCGMGVSLILKIAGINGVIGVKGFLDLSEGTRQTILGEYQRWLEEYFGHVRACSQLGEDK